MKETQTTQESLNAAMQEAQTLKLSLKNASDYASRLEFERGNLKAERDALSAMVEQLKEEVFKLQCFDVDVITCLKTMAFEHNHSDIALYQELAKKCMSDIASRKPLSEIRAEAYEAGFSKAKHVYKCELGYCSTDISEWFDEWEAAKRQGDTK